MVTAISKEQVNEYRLEICNQIFQLEDSLEGKNEEEQKRIDAEIRELGKKLDYFVQPEKKAKIKCILTKGQGMSRKEMLFLFNAGMSVPNIAEQANIPLRKVISNRDYALRFRLIHD